MSVSRFKNGVTTSNKTATTGQMGVIDPSMYHVFFDDFDRFLATEWKISTTEAGAGSATEAASSADGGVLVITNDNADNDHDFLQLSGDGGTTAHETFKFEAGKKLFFKSRFKVSDATQSEFVMGLQIADTNPINGVTDGVYFQKDDGDALLDVHVEKNSTATSSTGVHTVVDDTYLVAGFYYDGIDSVDFFVDDNRVATLAVTNLPDDEELTISFGIQNGAAAAKVMSVDYILVAKER